MQKLTYLLIIFLSFLTCICHSLERSYKGDRYCNLHQKPNPQIDLIKDYFHLIPLDPNEQCYLVECSQCNQARAKEYGHYDRETDEEWTEWFWYCPCKKELEDKDYFKNWDYWMPTWKRCKNGSIYKGYFDKKYTKYFSFFYEYLQYNSRNPTCKCFWPEISSSAAIINDTAYFLFEDLFENTAFSSLLRNETAQKELFITVPNNGFSLHGLSLYCVCHSFLYSDYDWICRDLEFYSEMNYSKESLWMIKDKLLDMREKLALLFHDVYLDCLKKHPDERITQELYLVRNCLNLPCNDINTFDFLGTKITQDFAYKLKKAIKKSSSYSQKSKSIQEYIPLEESEFTANIVSIPRPNDWMKSDLSLINGTFYNELLLYKEAIHELTISIQLNPSNRASYIERATAYFETNQLSLALQDYENAKKLEIIPPFQNSSTYAKALKDIYFPDNKIQFSMGLLLGLKNGSQVTIEDFIPSTLSCCRGILHGLWWVACTSPDEVCDTFIGAAYDLGHFISTHSTKECLECVVPELKELSLSWNELNDYSKGEKMGFIIGKYGLDIYLFGVFAKGLKKLTSLKRINTMFTLENCALSQSKQTLILKESTKLAISRECLISQSLKTGKILVKNKNVAYHIMQPKHAWDKLIKLTGNVSEDFKKVLTFLEEHNIYDKSCLKNPITAFPKDSPRIIRSKYEKIIDNHIIEAVFETYLETGEIYLQNAWIVTK